MTLTRTSITGNHCCLCSGVMRFLPRGNLVTICGNSKLVEVVRRTSGGTSEGSGCSLSQGSQSAEASCTISEPIFGSVFFQFVGEFSGLFQEQVHFPDINGVFFQNAGKCSGDGEESFTFFIGHETGFRQRE